MIHLSAKLSEEVNRKCRAGNTTMVQLLTPYVDTGRNKARRYRQTDDSIMTMNDLPTGTVSLCLGAYTMTATNDDHDGDINDLRCEPPLGS